MQCTENAKRLSRNCESAQVFVIAASRAIMTPMFDDRARVAFASPRSESYAKRSRVDTDATRPRRISEHELEAAQPAMPGPGDTERSSKAFISCWIDSKSLR